VEGGIKSVLEQRRTIQSMLQPTSAPDFIREAIQDKLDDFFSADARKVAEQQQ
jgi:hypothetical protein